MALTDIKTYAVSHNKNGGSGGNTYIIGNQQSSTFNNINLHSINASRANISYAEINSLSSNDMSTLYLQTKEGSIQKLNGDILQYNTGYISSLTTDTLSTKKLKIEDIEALNAFIDTIQSKNITTENLTVTKQAHIFELIIDKIRAVGGQLIITPASCIIDYVWGVTSNDDLIPATPENLSQIVAFDVYWRATEASGRSVTNDFIVNDQAICQSFNNVSTGTSYNVSNKYYWRLVNSILNDTYINLTTGAISANQQNASDNSYEIVMKSTQTKGTDNTYFDNDIVWDAAAQTIQGIQTNVSWTDGTLGSGEAVHGTFNSASQIYGIQITPHEQASELPVTDKLEFNIKQIVSNSYIIPDKINIGVYFNDATFMMFNEVSIGSNGNVTFDLNNPEAPIEAIVIVSTAEVNWHLCHGMRISNVFIAKSEQEPHIPAANSGCDYTLDGYSAIPSIGDNLVQLGYRYQMDPTYPTSGTDAQKQAWIENNAGIYDRSAAQIISTYLSPDPDVRPPAYAQYTGINNFNLANHRGTYIDATGGYFKGKLVTTSGNVIDITDQGLSVDVDFYKIVPNYNVITIDTNSTINPSTLEIKFLISGDSQLSTNVPTNCVFYYSIDGAAATTINAGSPVSITISSMTSSSYITMSLLKNNELVDTVTMHVTDIQAAQGAAGQNGQYTQYAYKNATSRPNAPSSSTATYPPSGWTSTPSTPNFANGEYTWCTTRTVTYDSNNNVNWGTWSTPYRITGDNGQNGEDGKYVEFIYKRFEGEQTFTQNNYNPAYWSANQNPDYLGPSGYRWTDNPTGITSDYKYEYMSQREYNGTSFGTFSTPVIWSKWGEKGQDGDGYEYIYKLSDSDPGTPVAPHNPTYDEDIPNGWTDDPQGVSSAVGETKEWVSVRKKTNGTWGAYSPAALWAQYVPPGTSGKNGQYTQYAYKNATSSPSTPTSSSTYPPSGWTSTPSTPNFANGEYTWCTTRTITFDSSNNPIYTGVGAWSTPYRITGDNGQNGEDGKYVEFIYKRFSNLQTFGNNNNNPAYWSANQNPDYLGPSGYQWNDNPVGITDYYKYEYMSQREYNGTSFGTFSTPVLWSSYGEKGQDGDGVEYIFKHFTQTQSWSQNYLNPAYWNPSQSDQYLGPEGFEWSAEPQGADASYKFEYYSMRTKKKDTTDNVVKWGNYTTPKLWNQWVTDGNTGATGPQGPQGPTGPQGTDAEYDVLIPVRETFEVTIGSNQVGSTAYENITGQLYTDLIYVVAHIKGNNVTYYDDTQLSSFRLNIRSRNGTSAVGIPSSINSTTITAVTINGTVCDALRYQTNNFLAAIWPDYSYRQDYYYLCENTSLSYAPTQVNVTLVNTSTNKNLDSRDVQLIFRPSNLFSVTDSALNSIYQGFSGDTSGSYKTGMSQVYQDWGQIQTRVTDIENAGYVNQSTLTQTANQITSMVESVNDIVNVFGFNRGAKPYNTNCMLWPYGYGFIGWGTNLNRIINLGITEQNEDWTLYFQIRATANTAVTVELCDAKPNTTYKNTTAQSTTWPIDVTTSWETYRMVWNNLNSPYIGDAMYLGFIDFEQSGSNTIYVRNITLCKGDRPYLEFRKANEDLEYTGSLQGFNWDISGMTTEGNFRGLTVYKNSVRPNSSNPFYDLIRYSNITIKDKTPYTLSFWAKASGTNVHLRHFLYNGSWNLHIDKGEQNNGTDGFWDTELTTEWKHYTVHWMPHLDTLSGTASQKYIKDCIACRYENVYNNSTSDIYMAGVMFQEGWIEDGAGTETSLITQTANSITSQVQSLSGQVSTIDQKADNILLQVQDCGLNIDEKSITLNGDTNVNGTLTINDEDTGFLLAGSGGNTQISPKSLGGYNVFTAQTTNTIKALKTYSLYISNTQGNNYVSATWSFTQSFGNVQSGAIIPLTLQATTFMYYNSGTVVTPSRAGKTEYKVYLNNTLKQTFTNYSLTAATIGSFTASTAGELKIERTTTVYFNAADIQYNPIINGTLSYKIEVPNAAFQLIGYDGIATNFGTNSNVYFGTDGAYMKYGNNGLAVTASGITKWNGSKWIPLNTLNVVRTYDSTYTIPDGVDMVVTTSSNDQNVIFPHPSSCTGRVIYVKRNAGGDIKIWCNSTSTTSGNYFLRPGDWGDYEATFWQGSPFNMYISDGQHWIRGYQG